MLDDDKAQLFEDLGPVQHKPLYPPRDGMDGEQVFAEEWEKLMQEPGGAMDDCSNYMIRQVLYRMPAELTERLSAVAATFIMWLGTNCGAALLARARQLELVDGGGYGHGYLRAWHEHNIRETGSSHGHRLIEFILAPKDQDHWRGGQLYYRPELSVDDYEVVEQTVRWLSTENGVQFVRQCDQIIKHRRAAREIKAAVDRGDFKAAQHQITTLLRQ